MMENRNNLYKIQSKCEWLRRCIYLNKLSLLLHTRFRTTSFQQNNPISKKMPDSKTLCSIYELTLDEGLKDSFVPILETLCTLVFSLNVFLLYRTTDASLLSPQTTSIQNPILKIKDRRYVRHEATHRVNAIRCGYFLSPPPTLCIAPIAALPDLCPNEKHAVQWRYKVRSRGSQLLLLTADKEMRVVLYSVHTYLGFSLSNTNFREPPTRRIPRPASRRADNHLPWYVQNSFSNNKPDSEEQVGSREERNTQHSQR